MGYEQLPTIVVTELHGDMLSECRRPNPYVNSHVEDAAVGATYKLGLCERWALKVQSTNDTMCRLALIVLHEADGAYVLVELTLRECLHEIAPLISEKAWFKYENTLNGRCEESH